MKTIQLFRRGFGLACALSAWASLHASTTASTTPVGFVAIPALANSDTVMAMPLARPSVYQDALANVSGAVLTVAGTPGWTNDQFVKSLPSQPETYYVQFKTGAAAGHFYTVTANAAAAVTVDWNGETPSVTAGDEMEIVPYWTLVSLLPPAAAGVSFVATTDVNVHTTELQTIDQAYVGINPPIADKFYFYNGAWRKNGQPATASFDDTVLSPDAYFRLHNTATASTLTAVGSVSTGALAVTINAEGGATKQDNTITLRFAGTVTLAQSNLVGSGAFLASTSAVVRKDELRVFDNTVAGFDKPTVATYYYYNGAWRKFGAPVTANFDSEEIFTPGTGVIIRKAGTGGSAQTSFWVYNVSGL